jgi:predicted nucleic acid-binding protein
LKTKNPPKPKALSEHNLALYDASYFFLADKIKPQLVTADNKLFETAKDYFKLLNIKDYK